MAKDPMYYANRHTARAQNRTAGGTQSVPVAGRTGATIDPSPLKDKTAAKGATLASRPIEGGPALPANKAYNPIIDAESGEDPNAPRVETQQPIENRGGSARYMIQGGGPRIDLSFLVPERANKSFDPSKAIGGENVPYQESKGVGGFLRRMLGDESNKQNIEAQQVQGAKWEAENARTKERAERKQDLLEEIDAREKGTNKRFDATEARLTKGEETAARERQLDRDRAFLEGNRTWVAGEEKARREEARDTATQGFQARTVTLAEENAKKPRFQTVPDGKGGVVVIDETTGMPKGNLRAPTLGEIQDPNYPKDPKKKIIGTVPGGWEDYVPKAKVPANLGGGGQVDRGTGLLPGGALTTPTRSGEVSIGSEELPPGGLPDPGVVNLGGKLPPPPQNTALVPRFMRGAGDVMGGVMTSATDPLRYAGKEMYRQLLSSGAQQDPEVLKRLKKREEESSPWDIQ
jgi:hypothetical protein